MVVIPNTVQLELTNECNISCAMCARQRMTRPITHIDPSLYRAVVDQVFDYGWQLDWLHHMGDPLLWQHMDEIGYVFDKGLRPTISTNCIGLTPNMSQLLRDAGCDSFLFCIDTANEDLYRKLRGPYFRRVVRNIHEFLCIRSKFGYHCDVYIQWLQTRFNSKEGVAGLIGLFGPDLEYIRKRCDRIHNPSKNLSVNSDSYRSEKTGCPKGMGGCCILADGRVTPCCWDFDGVISFGNVGELSLKDAYFSAEATAFRAGLSRPEIQKHPFCKQCIGPLG